MRSEGGQDCQKAQDEAQASGAPTSDAQSSMGTGHLDSGGSFGGMDLNNMASIGDYRGGIKAEPDNWTNGGVLM